jgi:hypothetical protein
MASEEEQILNDVEQVCAMSGHVVDLFLERDVRDMP